MQLLLQETCFNRANRGHNIGHADVALDTRALAPIVALWTVGRCA